MVQSLQEAWPGRIRILGRNKPSFTWAMKRGCHVSDLPPATSLVSREALKNEGNFEREAGRKMSWKHRILAPRLSNPPDFSLSFRSSDFSYLAHPTFGQAHQVAVVRILTDTVCIEVASQLQKQKTPTECPCPGSPLTLCPLRSTQPRAPAVPCTFPLSRPSQGPEDTLLDGEGLSGFS